MPVKRNRGIYFDPTWLENCDVSVSDIEEYVKEIKSKTTVGGPCRIDYLLRAITCIDLTTLCGDDSCHRVQQLCLQAANPLPPELLNSIQFEDKDIHTAAVCVYPARVKDCKEALSSVGLNIGIASVAGGFPSGQYRIESKVLEIELAVADGATEIDVTINRDFALCGKWEALYDEVKQMRKACGDDVIMKTILATGELGSLNTVYKASLVCMMAGSDFIKTSTGKEKVNATLQVGTVMARAIKDYQSKTGFEVGFKPAGGIKTAQDVLYWQMLMSEILGKPWLFSNLFRIGASSLLCDIQNEIHNFVKNTSASNMSSLVDTFELFPK